MFQIMSFKCMFDWPDAKAAKIHDFIDSENIDCASFTEMWLSSSDHSLQQILDIEDDIHSFHHQPRKTGTGGGVGVLLKSTSKAKPLA